MNLNNPKEIKKLDKGLVSESIESLPKQIKQLIHEIKTIKIPTSYKKINNISVNGMGGSNLGARIIRSALSDRLNRSITITPGYEVPKHINQNTLYILSSYSGGTEETLSVIKELKKRKVKILGITSGGRLGKLMKKGNIPGIIFDPKENLSGQPRLGLGYSIVGIILLLKKAGVLKINQKELLSIADNLKKQNLSLNINIEKAKNSAKKIAETIYQKQAVLIGAEFIVGNLHAMRNQMCENAKNFAYYLEVPDMNHFAMEGLAYPSENKKTLYFLFFDSALYHPKVKKRLTLTKKVVEKNGINSDIYKLKEKTPLGQAFELLQLGTWITYYLGCLNNVDPVKIPWVDWFKEQLKK